MLVLVIAGLVGAGPGAEAAAGTRITASSSAAGTDPRTLSTAGGRVWRSAGRPNGVVLTTRYDRPARVDTMLIRGAGAALRIAAARVEFSDGSTLAVQTDASGSRRLVFRPRFVRWVRLRVVSVGAGHGVVGLTRWSLGDDHRTVPGPPRSRAATPQRVVTSSGRSEGTRWTASSVHGQWIRLELARPMEISAVRLTGGAATAATTVRSGWLRFSDGSRVLVGGLEPRGGAPTTIAFTARVTSSVTFVPTVVAGDAAPVIRSVVAYPVGVVPDDPFRRPALEASSVPLGRTCTGVRSTAPSTTLRLLCPSNGARTGTRLQLVVGGPAGAAASASAWVPRGATGAVQEVARARFDRSGTARLSIPLRRLTRGPTAVRIRATRTASPMVVQLLNAVGRVRPDTPSAPARGMDLKFDEDFSSGISTSRDGAGASYASGKPNSYGVDDFGEAIFAAPGSHRLAMSSIRGGYLRIPARALAPGETDQAGYGRRSAGGLIASAHMGGSGFAAQYGYFEARMLAPAGDGTWPAFWMLSNGSLASGGTTAEVDAVELYGGAPSDVYQTSHSWLGGGRGSGQAVHSRTVGADSSLAWHTYGARITPTGVTYYVDGRRTGSTPRVIDADQPFFFLADLALRQGWQQGLAGTGHRADLYVDRIRVWV